MNKPKHYYRLTYAENDEGIYRSEYLDKFRNISQRANELIMQLAMKHLTPFEEKNVHSYNATNKTNCRFYFTNAIDNDTLKILIELSTFKQIKFDLYFENELEIVWRGDSGIQVLGKVKE